MDRPTTRLVDCPECGNTSCYVAIPNEAVITDGGSIERSVRTTCCDCSHEFRVHWERWA